MNTVQVYQNIHLTHIGLVWNPLVTWMKTGKMFGYLSLYCANEMVSTCSCVILVNLCCQLDDCLHVVIYIIVYK